MSDNEQLPPTRHQQQYHVTWPDGIHPPASPFAAAGPPYDVAVPPSFVHAPLSLEQQRQQQQQYQYAAYMMAAQQQQQQQLQQQQHQQYALYLYQQQQQYEAAVRAQQEEQVRQMQHEQTMATLKAQRQQQQQQQQQQLQEQQQRQQQQREHLLCHSELKQSQPAVVSAASPSPPPALSVSVPSSSSTTPAPSAPPSVRSLTSADPASAHVESFSDFVSAFTSSYSPTALDSIPFADRANPSPLDWATLFRSLRLCAQKGVLAQVDAGLLADLLPFLLAAMDEASVVSLLHPPAGIDPLDLQCLLRGLDALLMSLYIITQRGIERTLLREDILQAAVQLLVHCVKRNVLPVLDPNMRDKVGKVKMKDKEDVEDEAAEDEDEEADDAELVVDADKRSAPFAAMTAESVAESGWWTFAESTIKDVLKKVELATTLLDTYVRSEVTRDTQLLPLIDLCFVIVAADHCQKLQTGVLPLISAIFMQGDEARRTGILDSLVSCFRSCASKRLQRAYMLHYQLSSSFRSKFSPLAASGEDNGSSTAANKGNIQMLVALLLLLVQSIAGTPLPATLQQDELLANLLTPNTSVVSTPSSTATAASTSPLAANSSAFALAVRDLHATSVKASWQFVCNFLERLQPNASTVLSLKASQQCIRSVLEDLLLVLFLPEWPAAEQLLHCFVVRMCALLDAPRPDSKVGNSGDRMQQLCIALVGVVCVTVKAHEVQVKRAPMAIRPPRQVDETTEASPHNLSEVTDCICGFRQVGTWTGDVATEDGGETATPLQSPVKADDGGGLFLDCDSCHVWFHGGCVGFNSQQEVQAAGSWVCESCMLRRAVDEQAEDMKRRAVARQSVELPQLIEQQPHMDNNQDDRGDAMEGEQSDLGATTDESAETRVHLTSERVMKQLLVNYLNDLCHASARDSVLFARQFHLARWMAAVVREEERALQNMASAAALSTALLANPELRFCLINWTLPNKLPAASSSPLLSREGQFRLSRQLSSRHDLCQSFTLMLSKLLDKCTDTQPTLRAKAVTALSHTVKVEPALLKNDAVREALLARVLDPSTSTRDAVLELIGGQLRFEPTALDEYFDTVISRIHDVGISVRKRVVRILHDVMLHPLLRDREKTKTHYVRVVGLLIERLRDEDTVQRLVRDTFQRLWFDDTDERIRGRRLSKAYVDIIDRLDEGRQAAPNDGKSAFSPDFHTLVRRVQSCVSEVNKLNGIDNLMSIVQQLMQAQENKVTAPTTTRTKKGAGKRVNSSEMNVNDVKRFPHSVRTICSDMCSCIVEQLVALDAAGSQNEAMPASTVLEQRQAAVTTLHLFTRIHPSFLVPHVYTLGPYLTQHTDKAYNVMLEWLSEILSEIMPLVRNPSTSLLDNMLKSLLHIVLQTSSPSLIAAAVPCLVVLTALPGMQHKRDELLKLALRFFSFLNCRKPTSRVETVAEEGNVIRSLLALGLLYKNVDVEEHSKQSTLERTNTKPTTYPAVDAVFELYDCFVRHSPPRVTIFALKGVIALFTRKPTLISRSTQLLQRALGDDGISFGTSNAELQVCALQCLRMFLQSEDARLQRAQKIDQQRAKEDKKKARSQHNMADSDTAEAAEDESDQDEATTSVMDAVNSLHDFHGKKGWLDSRIEVSDFLPTLVRICEDRIYQLCLSPVPAVRCEAVAFISVFLHQAVTNPADAMPTLTALLFDGKSQQAARQALHVLTSLANTKKEYLSFVEQKLMAGIRLGYAMQAALWTADSPQQFVPLDEQLTDGSTNMQIPFDYFAQLYGMLKKSAVQRKQIALNLVNDLMLSQLVGETAVRALTASPYSSISPSLDRSPSPSQPNRSLPTTPPLTATPHPPRVPSLSPHSMPADSDCLSGRSPADKFGFLCFVARLLLQLPFDDDEPLHLAFHLSKIINVRGATLLATMEQLLQEAQQTSGGPTEEQLSKLAALADGAMCICVMLRARHALVVAYAIEARLGEWSIGNATAKNAVKCSKKSDEQLSFHSFPFTHCTIADVNGATTASGIATTTAATGAPTTPVQPAQSGKPPTGKAARSRSKSASHSRVNSHTEADGALTTPTPAAVSSQLSIPPLLLAQYNFFVQQMADAALFMQAGSSTASRRSGRKGAKGRKKRKNDDSDRDSDLDDSREEEARTTPTQTAKRGGSRGKAKGRANGGTPQKKRRKRLTFSDKDITVEAEEEEDEDDGDWDGD